MTTGPADQPVVAADRGRGAPVRPVDEVDGFRFARTSDGINPDASPRVAAERGFVTEPAERDRLLGYLTGGALVASNNRWGTDGFDRSRVAVVPVAYRTDGRWIWPASVEYYLREHQVAPEPELYQRIREHGYQCPPVTGPVLAAARAATVARAERRRAARGPHAGTGTPGIGDPARFRPEVNEALLGIGWYRGRDVRDRVDRWLAGRLPVHTDAAFQRDGYPSYRPSPAALRVLHEFGGLSFAGGGPGVAAARTPFTVYPTGRPDDELMSFLFGVQDLGRRIGRPVFQVGDVERRTAALTVAEDGRVFLVGPWLVYAGADIDDALTRLVLGLAFPPEEPDMDLDE